MFTRSTLGSLLTALTLSAFALTTGCSAQGADDDANESVDAVSGTSTLARSYQGTIKNLPIMMRLEAQGTAVSGSYFYVGKATKGDVITLAGKLDGTTLTLDESVGGTKTGSFSGKIAADGTVKGTWKTPDGRTSLPLALPNTKLLTVERTIADKAPGAEPAGSLTECQTDAKYIEVFGLKDAAVEKAINTEFAKDATPIVRNAAGKCIEVATIDAAQTVKLQEKDVLVVQRSVASFYGGGAYENHDVSVMNISLVSGKILSLEKVLKAGAGPRLKLLVQAAISARTDFESPDDKDMLLDQSERSFGQLDAIDFELTADGIVVSFFNALPHAIQALDGDGSLIKWADLGDLLAPGSEAAALRR